MPFNFERLSDGSVLLTNLAGYFTYLDSFEELKLLIESCSPSSRFKEALADGLFLVEDAEEFVVQGLLASSFSLALSRAIVKPFLFMLVPTLRCDHGCTYCQVSRAPLDSQNHDLDRSKIPAIANSISRIGTAPYKIEFQGGEPLIRFDFICEFIDYFQKLVPSKDTEYIIATSLSLITEDIVSQCKGKNIHFSISLDGGELTHDKHRRLLGGGSFQKVKDGVDLVVGELGRDRIATVTTVTNESIKSPFDIVDAHIKLGFSSMFVRPLSPFGFAQGKYGKHYSSDEYVKFYSDLLDVVLEVNKKSIFVESFTLIHLEKIFSGSRAGGYVDLKSPGGHVLGALIYNYDGKVFGSDEARMIYEQHHIDGLSLGDVECLNLGDEFNKILIEKSFITENPGCDTCAFQSYCGSDVLHHLSTQGDVVGDKSLSFFCKVQKGVFDTIFTKYKIPEYRDMFERWMNG